VETIKYSFIHSFARLTGIFVTNDDQRKPLLSLPRHPKIQYLACRYLYNTVASMQEPQFDDDESEAILCCDVLLRYFVARCLASILNLGLVLLTYCTGQTGLVNGRRVYGTGGISPPAGDLSKRENEVASLGPFEIKESNRGFMTTKACRFDTCSN
jgi:hypothetical protein